MSAIASAAQASGGGSTDPGTIFKLDSNGVLTTLHSFEGNHGGNPQASLTPGESGSFYGTTAGGGTKGYGTIDKLDSNGVLTTLHSFQQSEGENPQASLSPGDGGSYYGTTSVGGASNRGTIYKLDSEGFLTTLHSCEGSDGENPQASLTPGEDGSFYGTTREGGFGFGVIFRLTIDVGRGLQLPGDCNQDGTLDLSDAICLFGFFLGTLNSLPCGDGTNSDPANQSLVDWQGDRRIDLSDGIALLQFLFTGGPPHTLAVTGDESARCAPIEGCPRSPSCKA